MSWSNQAQLTDSIPYKYVQRNVFLISLAIIVEFSTPVIYISLSYIHTEYTMATVKGLPVFWEQTTDEVILLIASGTSCWNLW